MQITQNIADSALGILHFEDTENLPKPIQGTCLFLAQASDDSILAHGVIKWNSVEYKIGTKK